MADKNKNGIPDHLEPREVRSTPFDFLTNIGRQGANFASDIGNWLTGRTPETPYRAGDFAFGLPKDMYRKGPGVGSSGGGGSFGPPVRRQEPAPLPKLGNTDLPSFMSFLQQAMEQVGGVGRVSYDPLRQDARSRGAEYDARLNAMYNQLANSIRDDGQTVQQSYQGAIDDTAARSAATQQQIQGASNVADDRNQQVLANLGIEQAEANAIAQGRDLNTQTARAVADAAARGQIATDRLTTGQQAAAEHNTNLAGAAGLEGNLQRARVQSELASLLAQYDMQEQEANRQAQQQALSQSMGLANALYEDAWRQRGYDDDVSRWLYEQQRGSLTPERIDPMQYSMNFIGQLQQTYPDLDMETLIKLLGPAASIGKLAN